MILVDTSVWIQHFRAGEPRLVDILMRDQVLIHPYVVGELALGSLADRDDTLDDLMVLPSVDAVAPDDVIHFIGEHSLYALGLGYVDVCLLASVRTDRGISLWTRDKRLGEAARRLGCAFDPA